MLRYPTKRKIQALRRTNVFGAGSTAVANCISPLESILVTRRRIVYTSNATKPVASTSVNSCTRIANKRELSFWEHRINSQVPYPFQNSTESLPSGKPNTRSLGHPELPFAPLLDQRTVY